MISESKIKTINVLYRQVYITKWQYNLYFILQNKSGKWELNQQTSELHYNYMLIKKLYIEIWKN